MPATTSDSVKDSQVKELFKRGAHFGYSKSRRHPTTAPFIFGFKNRTAILDIEKALQALAAAKEFLYNLGRQGKKVLWVGNKQEAQAAIKQAAARLGLPYVASRWIGGTITNVEQIRRRIALLNDWKAKKEKGELSVYTKKERQGIDKEITDLEKSFGSLGDWKELPAAFVLVDLADEAIAVAEAKKGKIPLVALANSDCNIKGVGYPIIANDASAASIAFFIEELAGAYEEGKKNPIPVPAPAPAPAPTPAAVPATTAIAAPLPA